ncbi:hypothetical protein CC79DRAFT_1372637 [Sarocladium strictum]
MKQQEVIPPQTGYVSESNRERETFRYDHDLDHSNYLYIKDGNLPHGPKLFTAIDSVLTGLAQLGTLQTGTARGFVSLFDSTHQYIVAEASTSIRIAPGLQSDDLALCGAAIPRSQGTCDHVLFLAHDTSCPTNPMELPVSVVPNLADDDRFTCRPYCQFPEGGQFYAGVPIRTRKGINIGTYCVMSPVVPSGWGEEHKQRLRDISRAIMTHLELRKSTDGNLRHRRFTDGLSSFVEGKHVAQDMIPDTPRQEYQTFNSPGDLIEQGGYKFPSVAAPLLSATSAKSPNAMATTPAVLGPEATSITSGLSSPDLRRGPSALPNLRSSRGSAQIFTDAAQVVQNTFAPAGCVFLDTSTASYDKQPDIPGVTTSLPDDNLTAEGVYPTSSSDEYLSTSHQEPIGGDCHILGAAAGRFNDANRDSQQTPLGKIGSLPRSFLARLLKMHPKGKIFNFDASGELQSNDSSEDSAHPLSPAVDPNSTQAAPSERRRPRFFRQREDVAIILEAFPGVRSVMFVPVWDPKRERWLAGGFIYSTAPTRFFSNHEDLSLVLAFSKVMSAEVLNMEVLQTEKAKSDALGSLSHELRSPLHGIILSTEVLNDTELTVYQGNATHIIETCCRTLLDTINHLLDFSKVNNVTQPANSQNTPVHPSILGPRGSFFGKQNLRNSVRLDGLVEDVVVSVVAGFNFEHISPEQFGPPSNSRGSANSRDSTPSEIKLPDSWPGVLEHQSEGKGAVAVYVTTDPTCNWLLDLQPGPLRRIVMNLVGNSLKHTADGTIHVKLAQETSRRFASHKVIRLTVSDTGSGISEDFLRHSLFQPFSQEDSLSPGIGLGLSLVKKMVTQMRGRIKVQSQLGEGTTIQVTLPHSPPLQPTPEQTGDMSEEDRLFEEQVQELSGLRVAIHGFSSVWGSDGRGLVETICCRWLKLSLIAAGDQLRPDVVLLSEETFIASDDSLGSMQALIPMIVVCRDAASAWRLHKAYEAVEARRVIEFVSQPIAPRIFARAILHAYRRWTGLPNLIVVPRPAVLKRAHSLGSGQLSPLASQMSNVDDICSGIEQATIQTPDQDPPEPSPAEMEAIKFPRGGTGSADTLKAEKKLLLVDDNSINLKVLSAIVTRLGYSFQTAVNGQEAVDTYEEDPWQFSAVLMDISMPIMDGLEATRRIRRHERKQSLPARPVLALTGLSSDDTHKEALGSGVDVFLTKPVKFATLREALASVGLAEPK